MVTHRLIAAFGAVAGVGVADVTIPAEPGVAGMLALLNVAGLGYIAYLLVKAAIAEGRETRAAVIANTAAVNRLVRMWALWLVTERRDVPDQVRSEARELLEEARSTSPTPPSSQP